jgi:hypothetical protein
MRSVQTEFDAGVTYVVDELNMRPNKYVNLFETTIRVLGGLLGAYHLSGDGRLVDCAHEIGTALLAGFDSPSPVPYADVNLHAHKGEQHAECTSSMRLWGCRKESRMDGRLVTGRSGHVATGVPRFVAHHT